MCGELPFIYFLDVVNLLVMNILVVASLCMFLIMSLGGVCHLLLLLGLVAIMRILKSVLFLEQEKCERERWDVGGPELILG